MIRRYLEEPLNKGVIFYLMTRTSKRPIISSVLNTVDMENKSKKVEVKATAVDKGLKVFQDITLSLRPSWARQS